MEDVGGGSLCAGVDGARDVNPSSSATSGRAASAVSSFSCGLPPATIQNSVSHKLVPSNYVLWRSQFFPLLNAYDLMGVVDGSCLNLSLFIKSSEENDVTLIPNSEYLQWH